MGQMLKGAAAEIPVTASSEGEEAPNCEDIQEVEKNLISLKWNLWHGTCIGRFKIPALPSMAISSDLVLKFRLVPTLRVV